MPPTDPEIREQLVETIRRFVAREVIPVASELEHADRYPDEIVGQMKEMGLFGVTIPEEYGGLGLDLLTYIGVVEELSYGWMSLSGVINTHTIAATILVSHGTEEQRRRWLPDSRRRAPRARCRSRRPTPGATPATSRAARHATATSTSSAARDVGDQW